MIFETLNEVKELNNLISFIIVYEWLRYLTLPETFSLETHIHFCQ